MGQNLIAQTMNFVTTRPAIAIALTCLLASTSNAAPEDLRFWKRAHVAEPLKLAPAKVELFAEPDVKKPLAIYDEAAINFTVTNPASVPFVKKADTNYHVLPGGLVKGAKPFTDREYAITHLPDRFAKLTLLQTLMVHKLVVDGRFGIVLTAERPVHVFIAVDERQFETFEKSGTPAWMQDYVPTGEKIITNDPLMKATNDAGYLVFVKKCPPGRIVLGPCCANPNYNSMYFTFFADAGTAEPEKAKKSQ